MAMAAPEEGVNNPLEIAEVLEKVLNYVPLGDLMNAREVARLWRDESLDNFRNSIVYVLDPVTESERFLRMSMKIKANGGGSISGEDASPLLSSSQSPSGIYKFEDKPIKKYRLTGPQAITPDGFNSLGLGPMSYFWNQCGPHLTYLDLKGVTYLFYSSFVEALISFFKLCPNLEELRFSPAWGVDGPIDYGNVNEDGNEEPIFDAVAVSWQSRTFMYRVQRLSEKQLASMKECLALKMKSLSIELTGVDKQWNPHCGNAEEKRLYSELWRCLFNLMPNLKKLSLDGEQYSFVMEALRQKTLTTNQLIKLDSFEYNDEKTDPSYVNFGLAPLWNYLKDLGEVEVEASSGPFRELKLRKIPFGSLWRFPRAFRNILLDIRTRIESLCIELRFRHSSLDPRLPAHCTFDFYNIIFPNLLELTLEYQFYKRNAYENFLFFDFSVFRGTPNLKRFKMESWVYLKRRLTVEDLGVSGPGQKWYRMDRVGRDLHGHMVEDLHVWQILPIEGDGTETFDPEKEENEIVLEKMKEFYFTGRFTTEALFVLGKWMKNLKEFAAIFDHRTISIPFVIWPGTLKQLTVLQPSFEGIDQVSGEMISDLREMYPEVKIVLEGQIDIPVDRWAHGHSWL